MKRTKRWLIGALLGILIGLFFALPGRRLAINSADDRQSQPARQPASAKFAIYDPDPNHIWNRLYRSLYIRIARDGQEYGQDELDPLLWDSTKHLLSGPSYQQAINALDEFISTHAERLITDPLKRALLQHDLWAIFDWVTSRYYDPKLSSQQLQLQKLQIRLAQAIRLLALPKEQIEKLPNTYADAVAAKTFGTAYDANQPQGAFLPADLFRPDGPWVPLSVIGGEPIAPTHLFSFTGRSVFLVFLHLPGGREATLNYLKKLQDFPQPWIQNPQDPDRMLPNPQVPQFPPGTQLALVRQMILIDNQGNLTPTNLTQQVQIRVHRAIPDAIPEGVNLSSNEAERAVDVFEFKMSRERLLAKISGGLRAVARDEKEFAVFQTHGEDLFEMSAEPLSMGRPVLRSCTHCHFRPGIHSVLSRERRKLIVSWDKNAIGFKQNRYDWGLLKGLWELPPTTRPR